MRLMKEEQEKDSDGDNGGKSAANGGEGGDDRREWIPVKYFPHGPPDSACCIVVASIWRLLPNVTEEDAAAV